MDYEAISKASKELEEMIFFVMEIGKLSYMDVMNMPYKRLKNYFKWKQKYDEFKSQSITGLIQTLLGI